MLLSMQAKTISFLRVPYTGGMKTGRPSNKPRPPFGERIHAAREALGLSQSQVAEKLGITQMAYSFWERRPVALRPEQIERLAEVLNVPINAMLCDRRAGIRKGGPTGKVRRVFEQVNQLPRSQQKHILAVVEAFVAQQGQEQNK
jgi:transcriptional regulator with XRE-family HTH domain